MRFLGLHKKNLVIQRFTIIKYCLTIYLGDINSEGTGVNLTLQNHNDHQCKMLRSAITKISELDLQYYYNTILKIVSGIAYTTNMTELLFCK